MSELGAGTKKLGFGLMRLPKIDNEFDLPQIKTMIDRFMEEGFTYFDTAWAYDGSEKVMKEALVDRYPRGSFTVATKLSAWLNCKTAEDAKAQLRKSLEDSGAGYFDYYLLHNLGGFKTHFFDDFNIWEFVQEMKAEGLIRHIGFSAHATPNEVEEILNAHPEVEFVQLQINYADWEAADVRARECYEVVRRHGKPVVIMEPVKGGMLAVPPEPVEKILKAAAPDKSCASWAIRFAASHEGVLTVLSGMSTIAQVEDNISFMKDFQPLSGEEMKVIEKAQEALRSIPIIPCTSCNYCSKVCPMNIGISGCFTAKNYLTLYKNPNTAAGRLVWLVDKPGKKRADACIKCGKCEVACPQHIEIRKELEGVVEAFKG